MTNQSGKEERHLFSVIYVAVSKDLSEGSGFDAHNGEIDAKEKQSEKKSEYPTARSNCKPKSQQKAAKIERVASVGIRSRHCQSIIFPNMARRPGTNCEPE